MPEYYTTEEAMAILKITSSSTFYIYVRRYRLPVMKMGRRYLINKEAFEKWLKAREHETDGDFILRRKAC